jgi:dihydrodipicolinate synthase/N-acetylneuraminate lyase
VKYAAWKLGVIGTPDVRLPLASPSDASRKTVDEALDQVGLLQAKAAAE